jgi:hypothetical protein
MPARLLITNFAAICLALHESILLEGAGVKSYGAVAQLGEHLLCKQKVTGSIPVSSTTA